MFNKKVEDKKYTPVYPSQAHSSTNSKVPLNTTFNRDYRSASMSKVAESKLATKNSVIKSNFMSSGVPSTSLQVPTTSPFNRDYRSSSLSKMTSSSGSKSATTNTISKNNFFGDDKYKVSSSSSSLTTTSHTQKSYSERRSETVETTTFSPTFGPTTLNNSKYDYGRPTTITPTFRAPIIPSVPGTSNVNGTKPVTSSFRPTQTTTPSIAILPQMKHLPVKHLKTNNKGYCVIFNHAKFKNPDLNRAGTEHDEKALLKVFKKFNIKCDVKPDYTLTKIRREIKALTKMDFSKYACLIIVILSHGSTNEQISSYDETYYLDQVITEPIFKNKTLAGKPKFFFIQACKGSSNSLVHTNIPQADSIQEKQTLAEINLMKCYSTYESRVAYRFSATGSIFINTFCEILNEDGDKKHIQDIMQAVGRKITSTKDLALQVPSVLSTMTANFYFCNLSFEE